MYAWPIPIDSVPATKDLFTSGLLPQISLEVDVEEITPQLSQHSSRRISRAFDDFLFSFNFTGPKHESQTTFWNNDTKRSIWTIVVEKLLFMSEEGFSA